MKKILLLITFLFSIISWGQILTFEFAGLAGNEVSATSNFNNANLSGSTITRGAGLTSTGNADRFNATNWALTSIANAVSGNNYMEFTVTPNSGFQFSVSSIEVNLQRSATGPSAIALRSSLNGYTTNLDTQYSIIDNTSTQSFTFTFAQANTSSAVTYRIYMYAEQTVGSGGIGDFPSGNDLVVNGTVTPTGPVSVMSGDWNVGSTWSTGTVPTNTDNVTISTGHIVHTNTALTRNGNTQVNGTFELRDGGFALGAGTFTYSATSGTLNFNLSSGSYGVDNTHVYWPTTNGPFNVNVLNNGMTLNAGANRVVNGVFSTASGGASGISFPSATLTLNGTCRIDSGGFFNNSPIYGASSTLLYNSGGTYNRIFEWSHNGVGTIGTTPGYPNNVQLSNNTILNYNNGTPLNKATAGNLVIDTSSDFSMNIGGASGGTLTIAGNITNNGNLTLGNAGGDDLRLNGNYTSTGTFNGNGRAIFFTRNGTQTVSSTTALTIPYVVFDPSSGSTTVQLLSNLTVSAPAGGNAIAYSSASDIFDLNGNSLTIGSSGVANVIFGLGTFSGTTSSNLTLFGTGSVGTLRFTTGLQILNNLTLNRQANVIGFTLGTDLSINGTLALTNGIGNLDNRTMIITNAGTITGASSSNYIIADFTSGGALRKNFNTTGSFTFPVGDSVASANGTEYSPATVTFASGTFSSGFVSISVEDSKEPNNEAPTDFISRYWNLTSNGITSAIYDFTGVYLSSDINGNDANYRSGRLRVSNTTWIEGANVISGSNTFSLTGMNTSGGALNSVNGYNFTAGNPFRGPEINIQQAGSNILTGATYDFGTQTVGTNTTVVFTVENLGLSNLNLGAATVLGGAYSLNVNYSPTVAASGSTTFTIGFIPTSTATFTGSISIPNNDTTGGENPYIINFTGIGQCLIFDFEGAIKGGYAADELLVNGKNWLFSEALVGGPPDADYVIGTKAVRMRADASASIEMLEDQTFGVSDVVFNYRRYGTDAITALFVVEYSKDLGNSWFQLGLPITPTATVQVFNENLNQSGPVRIRIRYFSGVTNSNHRINIDNLQLCPFSNTQEIEVFGNATTIQNNSTITKLENNTLFISNYFTGDGTITKTFTVTNRGTGTLTLTNPTFAGASEFTLATGLTSTSLTAGQSATFSVNFLATTAGLKTATVSIANNDSNENPFIFNIETTVNDYLRCTLGAVGLIAQQDFEASPATPVVGFSGVGGTFSSVGGTNFGTNRTTPSNKFIGSRSYQVTGATSNTITFNSLDVSNYQNISFSFRLGAYATTGLQGMESGDEVKVSVSIDGGITWTEQVRIRGNNNSIFDINSSTGSAITHNYNASITSPASYGCTNNSTNTFANSINISNLPNSTQLQIRIQFNFSPTGGVDEIWAIDNVRFEGQLPNTKTWNAGWTPPGIPTANDKVIIDGPYNTTTDGNLLGCECQINSGNILTITTGNHIEIQSDIRNNGTIAIQNSGSLIQINNLAQNTGLGSVSLDRTATIKRNDYVYWSTPTNTNGIGGAVTSISTDTPVNSIFKWIPTQTGGIFGNWINTTENMEVGKGYIVRGPNSHSLTVASNHTATFTGKQNNGIINVSIERGNYTGAPYLGPFGTVTNEDDNWNLIGNPYPSSIDAITFLQENTNIDGNVRIWTHGSDALQSNPNPFYNSFGYNYSANDYATYNVSGTNAGPTFNGKIASAQGFFVTMNDGPGDNTQVVVFNNKMRNKNYDNSQFFKNSQANVTDNQIERNRIWLDLLATNGEISRTLVGYIEGATMDKDRLYDASIFPKSLYFYSLINNQPHTIQGRTLPFDINDTVEMGLLVQTAGNYTIAIGQVDGLFTNTSQNIFLEDKLLNSIHDLRLAPYTFSSAVGQFNERFVLRYTNTVLSNQNFENESHDLVIVSNSKVTLLAKDIIESVTVYDLLGRSIYTKNNINSNKVTLDELGSSKSTLLIKATFKNGKVITKKTIF